VVTSNVSSLPEVTGDAAVLVDPYSVPAIVDGMRRVLTDAALAAGMRRKGFERAREFSWERAAARTRELYREVAGRREADLPAAVEAAPAAPAADESAEWRPTLR
jgi:glycosyltransferase involved in cell wall biosynthesis